MPPTLGYSTCSIGKISLCRVYRNVCMQGSMKVCRQCDWHETVHVLLTNVCARTVGVHHDDNTLLLKWLRPASVSWKGASSPAGALHPAQPPLRSSPGCASLHVAAFIPSVQIGGVHFVLTLSYSSTLQRCWPVRQRAKHRCASR